MVDKRLVEMGGLEGSTRGPGDVGQLGNQVRVEGAGQQGKQGERAQMRSLKENAWMVAGPAEGGRHGAWTVVSHGQGA